MQNKLCTRQVYGEKQLDIGSYSFVFFSKYLLFQLLKESPSFFLDKALKKKSQKSKEQNQKFFTIVFNNT